jgi:aspartate racemase
MNDNINLGILTGISYVTGLDYYKSINEYFMQNRKPVYELNPNPNLVFVSVDCDKYVHLLEKRNFDKVSAHLMDGITKLVNSGCNYLAIASNTGHICYENVKQKYPDLNIIHIADCIAWELKKKSYYNVGLVGTKPTMEEDYLIGRLQLHGINTIVPEHVTDRIKIYDIIRNELSYNVFKDDSRKRIIDIIKKLTESDVVACISGCTEIELLVKQTDIPKVELLPSAQIHIQYITDLLLGRIDLSKIEP